jgi:TIR domain
MPEVALPAKCFISHAYADAAARDALIERLPPGVTPFVFPPITVKPEEFVSDPLIDAVINCDGLIYLRGGASDRSFWVALERDYALRAGKKVFAFDMATGELSRDTGSLLDLAAFASYSHRDTDRVRHISDYLNQHRYFDMWLDATGLAPGSDWKHEIQESLSDRLARGGYAVVFWSHAAGKSEFVTNEIKQAAKGMTDFNDRVLFGLLEPCPLPDFWLQFNEPYVQLYGGTERSATQRLDDLVVRLYWLIYRKTRVADPYRV